MSSPKRYSQRAKEDVGLSELISKKVITIGDKIAIHIPKRYSENGIDETAELCRDGWINYYNETFPDIKTLMAHIIQQYSSTGKLTKSVSFLDKNDQDCWNYIKIEGQTKEELLKKYHSKSSTRNTSTRSTTSRSKSPTQSSKVQKTSQKITKDITKEKKEEEKLSGHKRKNEIDSLQTKKQLKTKEDEEEEKDEELSDISMMNQSLSTFPSKSNDKKNISSTVHSKNKEDKSPSSDHLKTPISKNNNNDKLGSTPDSLPSSPYTSSGSDISPFKFNPQRAILPPHSVQRENQPIAVPYRYDDAEPKEQDLDPNDDLMDDQENGQALSYPPLSFVSDEVNEINNIPSPVKNRITKTDLGREKNEKDSLNFSSFSSIENSSIKTLDLLSLPKVNSFARINSDDVKSEYFSQFDHPKKKSLPPLNNDNKNNENKTEKNTQSQSINKSKKIDNYFSSNQKKTKETTEKETTKNSQKEIKQTKSAQDEPEEEKWISKSKTKRSELPKQLETKTIAKTKQTESDNIINKNNKNVNKKNQKNKEEIIVISSPSPSPNLSPNRLLNPSPLTPINNNYFSQTKEYQSIGGAQPSSPFSLLSQSLPSPMLDSSLPSMHDDSLDNLISITSRPNNDQLEEDGGHSKLNISDDIDLEEVLKTNQPSKVDHSKNNNKKENTKMTITDIAIQRKNMSNPTPIPSVDKDQLKNKEEKEENEEIIFKKKDDKNKTTKYATHTLIPPKHDSLKSQHKGEPKVVNNPPTSITKPSPVPTFVPPIINNNNNKIEMEKKEIGKKKEEVTSFNQSGSEIKSNSSVPIITISGLTKGMIDKIKMLTKKIGGQYDRTYSKYATHLVILCDESGTPKSTIKFYQAIIRGAIIVSYSWILESFKEQRWVDEKEHIVKGHPGVHLSRENIKKNNYLFEKYSFCLFGEYATPSKSDIEMLILDGHGKLLPKLPPLATTPREELANESIFVLCHPSMSNEEATDIYFKCGIHPLALHYILDCISQYKILEIKGYKFLEDSEDDEPSVPQSLAF